MKQKSIRILYRLTSFLADKTKGVSIFAGWKIALGSLLIGTAVTSCGHQKQTIGDAKTNEKDKPPMVACYKPAPPDPRMVACYNQVLPERERKDPPIDSTLTNLSLDIKEENK